MCFRRLDIYVIYGTIPSVLVLHALSISMSHIYLRCMHGITRTEIDNADFDLFTCKNLHAIVNILKLKFNATTLTIMFSEGIAFSYLHVWYVKRGKHFNAICGRSVPFSFPAPLTRSNESASYVSILQSPCMIRYLEANNIF